MEVQYAIQFTDETHKVKVTCECGKCALLSTLQLQDLREKLFKYRGKDSPESIKVIDSPIKTKN